jgi:hypothetical protein
MPAPTVNVHIHKRLGPGGRCLYWLTCSTCGTNGPAWSRSAADRDLHAHLAHHATARPAPDHWSPRLEGPHGP